MSKYFYEGTLNTADSLVIYKYDPNDSILISDSILIKGYINSATIIIDEIKKSQLGPERDKLIYPLLHIYCLLLEFSLKICIRHLLNHKEQACCKFLKLPTNKNISNLLNKHDTDKLFETFREFINTTEFHPHHFDDLSLLSAIIKEFMENDINCFSSRYHYNKEIQPYELYKKPKNIRLYTLHEDIIQTANTLSSYIQHENFSLCTHGYFTFEGINQLKEILNFSIKNENLFNLLSQRDKYKNKPKIQKNISIVFPKEIMKEVCQKLTQEEIEFFNKIQTVPLIEQNAILKCLYIGTLGITDAIDSNFSGKLVTKKIYEYRYFYKKGTERIKEYINYFEQFI